MTIADISSTMKLSYQGASGVRGQQMLMIAATPYTRAPTLTGIPQRPRRYLHDGRRQQCVGRHVPLAVEARPQSGTGDHAVASVGVDQPACGGLQTQRARD